MPGAAKVDGTYVQGDMLAPDEAIKLISECADAKGRIFCEDYAMMLL